MGFLHFELGQSIQHAFGFISERAHGSLGVLNSQHNFFNRRFNSVGDVAYDFVKGSPCFIE
ncbi:hypothetical protein ALQ56_200391 [Pseudomonas syringae pv. papulans]|nr:hypothetical protein ALQ56_200391 [Pseudomonas syringae pv. papulans]